MPISSADVLPMKEESSVSFPPQSPTDASSPKEPLGVLIVEDDQEIRDMVSLMVRKMGHQVYTAATGKEALARLHEHRPDIVLLDIMMPEMDGYEFLRQYRRRIRSAISTSSSPLQEARSKTK
ncbi:MAG: response regulator [Candidatus Binatia bacterium]|nr:response regulator [Candidatus Binatia bacterium]